MENIKGWNIDLKTVYGGRWDDKVQFHPSDDLWESADGSVAGLLYGVAEVGMQKEVGCLAVFRRKEKPVLVHNFARLQCWYSCDAPVQFGENRFLFVHRYSTDIGPSGGRQRARLCVLDLAAGRFAQIDSLPENFYRVRHVDGTEYGFTNAAEPGSAGISIDLKGLSWGRLPRGWWDQWLIWGRKIGNKDLF
jgi:hypothetical protein